MDGYTARTLKVTTDIVLKTFERGELVTCLVIETTNTGDMASTVAQVGILLPGGEVIAWPFGVGAGDYSAPTPHDLAPTDTHRISHGAGTVGHLAETRGYSGQIDLRAFARDSTGNTVHSDLFTFDVDKWTRMPDLYTAPPLRV